MSLDPTYGIFHVLHEGEIGEHTTVKRIKVGTEKECNTLAEATIEEHPEWTLLLIDLDDIDDLIETGMMTLVSVS